MNPELLEYLDLKIVYSIEYAILRCAMLFFCLYLIFKLADIVSDFIFKKITKEIEKKESRKA